MQLGKQTLERQRIDFSNRKFIATPLAGLIIWSVVGVTGFLFPVKVAVWTIFIGAGATIYLALFLSKFTGEDFLNARKQENEFDRLFFYTVAQALLVYAIAIPFFIVDYTSLPLTIGILTGLMWFPFSWIIKHWVGVFHALTRTLLVLALWYLLPSYRFISIPIAIVLIYIITLIVLANRNEQ